MEERPLRARAPRRKHPYGEHAAARCRSGNGCSRHDWLVTASTEHPNAWPREAWGTVHVKANGSLSTACGLFAVGWVVFFEQTFHPRALNACPHCARVVSLAGAGPATTTTTTPLLLGGTPEAGGR